LTLLVERRKGPTVFGQAAKQGSRLPKVLAVALAKLLNAAEHGLQPYCVSVEHGTSAPRGESVAVEVHHVDIGRAESDAFPEQVRAFVYQGEKGAIDDLVAADGTALNAGLPPE